MLKNIGLKTIFIFIAAAFCLVIYIEFQVKVQRYLNEKLHDVKVQYNDKILSSNELVKNMLDLILLDEKFSNLYSQTLYVKTPEKLSEIRFALFDLVEQPYKYMNAKGILQLHFHLPNGDSFLRMHKVEKFGDNLLKNRESVKQVIETHKSTEGFEIGKYFEGFRYVYPIIYNDKYIGSVEASLSSEKFIKNMTKYLDAHYSMIMKKNLVDETIDKNMVELLFHISCFSNNYYMNNNLHDSTVINKHTLSSILPQIKKGLATNKSFVIPQYSNTLDIKLYTFYKISDVKNRHVGYIIAVSNDDSMGFFIIESIVKIFFTMLLLYFVYYFMRQNQKNMKTLEQFKSFVDLSTLVSKTDLKGKITYANQMFVDLSGYSYDELIGKAHNIVRHPDVPKKVFKEMWETIQSGKVWSGKIKNRRKDGSFYIVYANVFPIFNELGKIIEYIAIRHDITEVEKYKEILESQIVDKNSSLKDKMNLIEQYENAIDKSTALFRFCDDGIISYVNQRMLDIVKKSKEDLIGKKFKAKNHANVTISLQQDIKNTILKNNIWTGLIECEKGTGANCYLNSTILPIKDIYGEIIEYMGISYDVTHEFELIQEIEDTQKEVVATMGAIGESRSKETGLHVKRVAEYSYLLAKLYGLNEKESQLLKQASPMHDIGKVGIPDSILNKPGKLTPEEFEIMKTHAELGYEMLKNSKREILKAASIVAYEHHEKWNGNGYPKGTKGENIHIYGRITAIADVFDALGHDRVYKKAWEMEKILKLFKEESNKHFDPKLVQLLFDNLDKFLILKERFDDSNKII